MSHAAIQHPDAASAPGTAPDRSRQWLTLGAVAFTLLWLTPVLLIVMTRAFPLAILALPLITRFIQWGIYDTVFAVALVHTALALPFAILVTPSLFMGIPRELEEAALTLGAFTRIVVPLALPGLAATAIFSFVISWNEVFAATLLTLHERTLTAFLFTTLEESPLHLRFAGAFLMIVPPIFFIFLVRKYLFSMWGISNR